MRAMLPMAQELLASVIKRAQPHTHTHSPVRVGCTEICAGQTANFKDQRASYFVSQTAA